MRSRLGVVLALATLLGACAQTEPAAEEGGPAPAARLATLEQGVLTACVAPTPALVEPTAGGWTGFDVAVLDEVAGHLALELSLVEASFDELVAGVALNGGRCDVAAAGIVDAVALDAVARPSDPYRNVHRLLVALEGEPVEPAEVTGTVAVVEGSVAVDATDELPAAVEVVTMPSRADLRRALVEGVVDAALVTVVARSELEEQVGAQLVVLTRLPSGEESVLLLPLGAPDDAVAAVDGALATLREDGTLEALRAEWLAD